ncbi:hypothetical protein Q4F19_18915 [Sphingomonas sp. BIUV-7]|uniref:Porin n=1 Tax=Sphingomonas natans TaxID=3063330 RepID=A0ABT8YDN4_9SPHN|nr:hypothetical protein [Sphingomonas sp. BIUV-7]MDO6416463.1 hypothetical protein [Sphingomonas sp. BIUV-7]
MIGATVFLILQATVYGPALPVKTVAPAAPTEAATECPPSETGEIVVCKRRRATPNQRLQDRTADAEPDQRLNLKLSDKLGVKGGGPVGRNGQSVGVGVRLGF